MKIQASCFEVGLGHYRRLRPVLAELKRRGHDVICCADDPVYGMLREDQFGPVYKVQRVSWIEDFYQPEFMANLRAIRNIVFKDGKKLSVFKEVRHRYHGEKSVYYRHLPDVILSDSDPVASMLARRRKKPSVLLSNQTNISASGIMGAALFGLQKLAIHFIKDSYLVIPDLAPPYTISEDNLRAADAFKRREYVGPFVEMPDARGRDDYATMLLGGSRESRIYMREKLKPILSSVDRKWRMCLGIPGGNFDETTDTYEIRSWLTDEEMADWKKNSLVIVNNATLGICFDSIAYGKPFVTIPTHTEQRANAKKCERLGLSRNVERIENLEAALNDVIANIDWYKGNTERVRDVLKGCDAVKRTVEIVESVAK